jgi:hypothetical protein
MACMPESLLEGPEPGDHVSNTSAVVSEQDA